MCHIFENLGSKDMKNATLVCKDWSSIIDRNAKLTENFVFKYSRCFRGKNRKLIKRRYSHIEFSKLPPVVEFTARFRDIRQFVHTISFNIFKRVSMDDIGQFLCFFDNLRSLKLSQGGDDFTRMIGMSTYEGLHLKHLQSLSIEANSCGFILDCLEITEKTILKSFKLEYQAHSAHASFSDRRQLSRELTQFLNNQVELKFLEMKNLDLCWSQVSAIDFRNDSSIQNSSWNHSNAQMCSNVIRKCFADYVHPPIHDRKC